jgi:hypothetical protein
MSTTTHAPTSTQPATLPVAVATFVASCALISLGTVASGTSDEHGWREFLIVCGLSLVAVALVFGLAVARLQDSPRAGAVGLALSIVGLLTVAAFWAGITPAFAVGGVLLGMAARRSGHRTGLGTAAIAVGALAIVGYLAMYIGDWVSSM